MRRNPWDSIASTRRSSNSGSSSLFAWHAARTLTVAHHSGFGIGDGLVEDLAASGALDGCSRLFLGHNRLTAYGMRQLLPGVDANHLVFLDLGGNKLGSAGGKAMAEAIGVRMCVRVRACVRVCARARVVLVAMYMTVVALLQAVKRLEHLNLEDNDLGDHAAAKVAAALLAHPRLTRLILRSNKIGIEGAKAIADLICHT